MIQQTKSDRWGPLSGVAFVVLIVAAFIVGWSTPMSNASAAKVIAWYSNSSHKRNANISALLIDIAVVVGFFFFGYLRDRLRGTELGKRLAPVAFGGAIVFGVGGLIGAGTTFALTDVPKDLAPAAAQALNVMSNDIWFPATFIGMSILTLASSIVFLKSRTMPTWFGWFGIVIGVAGLAGPIGFFAFLAVGLWLLILSYLFYSRPVVVTTSEPRPMEASVV